MLELKNNPPQLTWLNRHARVWMSAALALSDIFSIILAFTLALLFRKLVLGMAPVSIILTLFPFLFLLLLVFFWRGLYPAVGVNSVDELRLTVSSTSLIFLVLLVTTYLLRTIGTYSRLVLIVSWVLTLLFIQLDRWLLRFLCSSFWGEPIVIFGEGPNTDRIVTYLLNNKHLALRPGVVIPGKLPPSQEELHFLSEQNIRTALLVTPEVSEEIRDLVINDGEFKFSSVILISYLGSVGSLGVVTHDLEGILGVEVRQNLLNFWQRSLKRIMDTILAPLFLVLLSPFLLVIALAIKLEDGGPVFYNQCRIGRYGGEFVMLKFRTMHPDAEQALNEWLSADQRLKDEWDSHQKLKNDPRLTRVGRFLRKWSLDEWPQLVNVIRGEMSLVGPRPFFPDQNRLYGDVLNLYYRVHPGMTGMWQVTSRNEATFADRVRLDEYYIRNWSIWLDIYIMLRTVWVVLRRRGAY